MLNPHRRRVKLHKNEGLRGFVEQHPDGESCHRDKAAASEELMGHDGDAVITCADNIEFMSMLPDGKFKLIVTSPPYNLGKTYEEKLTLDEYISKQTQVIDECVRLVDSQGSICWQVGNYVHNGEIVPLDSLLYPLFLKHGLKLRNRIIWRFGHGLHCTKRLSGRYETINWWTKGDDYTWRFDPIRVPQKYPNKKHFRGPTQGSFRVIRKERTLVMFGNSRMSRATILKKPSILPNSPSSLWRDRCYL